MSGPAADGPAYPAGAPEAGGRALRIGDLSARAYAPLAPALLARLPAWYADAAAHGEVLRSGAVVRIGGLVVKRFPAPSVFGWVRAARATRSAARHFWCLPVPSPRPLVALWRDFASPSVLVREYVAGELLSALDEGQRAAEEALAPFLASLARHAVLHGDLHPQNLLWDGARWWLLDVDGVRHGLHSRRRVWLGMWARCALYLGEARARALHARCMTEVAPRWQLAWEDVRREETLMRARRAHALPSSEAQP